MKHLKKFEEFDMGRFSDMEMNEPEIMNNSDEMEEQSCPSCNCTECECKNEYDEDEMQDEFDEDEAMPIKRKVWGDELVEKKKINKGFQAYLDKQKNKKEDKKEDKTEKGGKKAKPDFLDLDKDGDKKESMKKAAKDAKEDKGGKEDNKKPKFGSPEWQKKYGKKK